MEIYSLGAIELCTKPLRTTYEEPERLGQSCLICLLLSWNLLTRGQAFSTSNDDQEIFIG